MTFSFRWCRRRLAVVAMASGLAACSSSPAPPELVPVSPTRTGEYHPGQFVWHDLVTDDVDAAKAFYGGLFGWTFEDVERDGAAYTVIRRGGEAIAGMTPIEDVDPSATHARWLSLMSVEDVDDALRILEEAGGTRHFGPVDNPTRGRMVLAADPQGALLVLLRANGGDPPNPDAADIEAGEWLWNELWTRDVGAATDFSGSLAGHTAERPSVAGAPEEYRVLVRDGRPRAGVNRIPWDDVQPNWLPYVRVDDPAAVAARAEELGGLVLIAPGPSVRGGAAALLMDPTGAAFAVQRWPVDASGTPGGVR